MTAPVVPLMPLGRSTARTGAPLALIASIMSSGSPFTVRSRPAPNSASMISAGLPIACGIERQHRIFPAARRGGRIALQAVALAQQDDGNLAAARGQFGRGHKTVAAIVAGPGDHQDRPLLDEVHRGLGDGLARAQHQREARGARGDGEPIGTLHLGGGQNFHAKSLVQAPYPEAFPIAMRSQAADDCIPI